MDEERTIFCDGGPMVSVLVQMLEQEGVRVEWTPPEERRGLDISTDIQSLVVALTAYGTPAAMKRAAAAYRKRFPKAHVRVQASTGRARMPLLRRDSAVTGPPGRLRAGPR
jgi:hypothetical protein